MLFVLAFLVAAWINLAASQHVNIPDLSAFLDADQWSHISNRSSIQCTWTAHTSEGVAKEEATFTVDSIVEVLHSLHVAASDRTGGPIVNTHISILESHSPDTILSVPVSSPGKLSVTIIEVTKQYHLTPEEVMLCAEMLLASRRINVVLPFQVALERTYVTKHNTEALERLHRGAAFLVPPADTIDIFHDKKLFADWMVSNNMSYLLPTVYKTIEEVAYPAVIKATTNTGGHDVIVVQSRGMLEQEIQNFGNKPYIIEEAISGEIEVRESVLSEPVAFMLYFLCLIVTWHQL